MKITFDFFSGFSLAKSNCESLDLPVCFSNISFHVWKVSKTLLGFSLHFRNTNFRLVQSAKFVKGRVKQENMLLKSKSVEKNSENGKFETGFGARCASVLFQSSPQCLSKFWKKAFEETCSSIDRGVCKNRKKTSFQVRRHLKA